MRLKLWLGNILLIFGSLFNVADAFLGINIGGDLSKLPSPVQIVEIIRAHQTTHVRLLNSDTGLLKAFSYTRIKVMISVANSEIQEIGESPSAAASWINTHVVAFKSTVNITAIAVGNDVLSSSPKVAPFLAPAMNHLYKALLDLNLTDVKVSTPLSMNLIAKHFPPSEATFNLSWNKTIFEILDFLKNSYSFYMLNAYPYDVYVQSNGAYPIQYALFDLLPPNTQIVDPNTRLHYENMLDAMVDATYYSIAAYKTGIPVMVTQTGWPWAGAAFESLATVFNAESFNNRLVKRSIHMYGTPSQPHIPLNSYIYELFNEDKGSIKDQSYGMYFRNGSAVYNLLNTTLGFCVARKGADEDALQRGLDWACGQGQADCTALQSGQPCFLPYTKQNHASYAYNDYYQKMFETGATCSFGDTAIITYIDPSYGSCIFRGSNN